MRLPKNLLPCSYRVFLQPHLYMQIMEDLNGISVKPDNALQWDIHHKVPLC